MADERGERGRSGRIDERHRHQRCRPHYGDIEDRLEILRRPDRDEAVEALRTIIDAAFFAGVACGCCECGCRCHDDEDRDRRERRRRDGD